MADVPNAADVVVIGGGAHGTSLAYHLARKRAGRVVLIERKFIASGPSGVGTAMVRRYYGMDFFTRTASAAADLFQHWADVIGGGEPGFQQVGYFVLVGTHEAADLKRNVLRAQALGARVILVSQSDLKALVPQMTVDDVAVASYERESGYANPFATTNALANRARELGAVIVHPVTVAQILTRGGRVLGVTTSDGTIHAPVVVNCAGLYAGRLLRPLGIEIEILPTRHQMCLFRRPPEFEHHPAVVDRLNETYMRPQAGGLMLHGLGRYEEVVDPDNYNEGADSEEIRRNAKLVARRFQVMGAAVPWGGYAGLYDRTPDEQPVLGAISQYGGLYVDFGWSGHGFKHAPVIGDLLSDLILHGTTQDYDLTPFRWSRFEEGDLLPPASTTAPANEKLRAGLRCG
jgi:sarcosine oxidase, subunit beta